MAILGGAKVSDKLEVIENLIPRVDALLIGGAMAYTFFKARSLPVGKSLVEDDLLDAAREIEARAKARSLRLELPVDHVVAPKLEAGRAAETLAVADPAIGDRMGLDIGPKTIETYRSVIAGAKTVIWNGPMGVFEIDAFAHGTMEVAKGGRLGQGHDDHRRRRFDRGRGQGGRHRSDHAHFDRRRRVAGIPWRARAARSRSAARTESHSLSMNAHPFIAANWKMYKTVHEAVAFIKELRSVAKDVHDVEIVVAPPFTALRPAAEAAHASAIGIAGQNLHWEREGAFTGEVSAAMLKEAGAEYVIIGHSERRRLFGDTDADRQPEAGVGARGATHRDRLHRGDD